MKKLVLALFAVALVSAMMFGQGQNRILPNFNNQGRLTGETGTFTLNVIQPMTIALTKSGGNLGTFVESTIPYALTVGSEPAIVWEMTAENGYEFYMYLQTTKENNGNKIKLGYDYYQSTTAGAAWTGFPYPLLTDAGGWWTEGYPYTGLRVRVTEVQALNRGASTFPFVLSVSYTQF